VPDSSPSAGEFSQRGRAPDKLRFDLITWSPTGPFPSFHSYDPDSLPSFPDLSDLYSRWIRGNRLNNNGDDARIMDLILNLRQLNKEAIPGDFAEWSVWRGNSAATLAEFAAKSNRHLFLFDTFSGFDQRDLADPDQATENVFADSSINYVPETVVHPENTIYLQGVFPDLLNDEVSQSSFALVHIDFDLYRPIKQHSNSSTPLAKGGIMLVHDYDSGTQAVDEFCATTSASSPCGRINPEPPFFASQYSFTNTWHAPCAAALPPQTRWLN
jgi:hypothetical protein